MHYPTIFILYYMSLFYLWARGPRGSGGGGGGAGRHVDR